MRTFLNTPVPGSAIIAVSTAVFGMGGVVQAQATPETQAAPEILQSDWVARPSAEVVARAYPPGPLSEGLGGKVLLDCFINEAGIPKQCEVERETPPGRGFGAAALALASDLRAPPTAPDGRLWTGARILIPVTFSVDTPAVGGAGFMMAEAPRVIRNPDWAYRPTGIREFYPSAAAVTRTSGAAAIKCLVTADGRLRDCKVVKERPKGYGFGDAAVKMSRRFRLKPLTLDGKPVAGGEVTIPVGFSHDGSRTPRLVLSPGDAAVLITPIRGTRRYRVMLPCPGRGQPERRCAAHPLEWAVKPHTTAVRRILNASDQKQGISLVECSAAKDGRLEACRVGGQATEASEKAILSLVAEFRAPARAGDGVDIDRGRILIGFDWAEMREMWSEE